MRYRYILPFLLLLGTCYTSRAQTEPDTTATTYLAYSYLGRLDITTFPVGSEVHYWVQGGMGKHYGEIVAVTPDVVVFNTGAVHYDQLYAVRRFGPWQQRQMQLALIGGWGSLAAGVGLYIAAVNAWEWTGVLGYGAYQSLVMSLSMFAAKPLIARKYRATQGYGFAYGQVSDSTATEAPEGGPSSPAYSNNYPPPPRPRLFRKPEVYPLMLGLAGNGDLTLSLNAELLLTQRFSVLTNLNPIFTPNFALGSKIYIRPYRAQQFNWYVGSRAGFWESYLRPITVTGVQGGAGVQYFLPTPRFAWTFGAQFGMWWEIANYQIQPELSFVVGLRIPKRR